MKRKCVAITYEKLQQVLKLEDTIITIDNDLKFNILKVYCLSKEDTDEVHEGQEPQVSWWP
jgi:hypothetical protein